MCSNQDLENLVPVSITKTLLICWIQTVEQMLHSLVEYKLEHQFLAYAYIISMNSYIHSTEQA